MHDLIPKFAACDSKSSISMTITNLTGHCPIYPITTRLERSIDRYNSSFSDEADVTEQISESERPIAQMQRKAIGKINQPKGYHNPIN